MSAGLTQPGVLAKTAGRSIKRTVQLRKMWSDSYCWEELGSGHAMLLICIELIQKYRPIMGVKRHFGGQKELFWRAHGKSEEAFQLREPEVGYNVNSGAKNDDIGAKNSYSWNINLNIPTR